jgi:hypothetical protein
MRVFSLETEWRLYLQRMGLDEARMHPAQLRETKRAFFGACGQMLILLRDKVGAMEEVDALTAYKNLMDQVEIFFNGEIQKMKEPPGQLPVIGSCLKAGCNNEADFTVHFELKANKNGGSATSGPVFRVCKEHYDIQWEDVCTEESWKVICDAFRGMGRAAPSKQYSGISLIPIKK